MANALTVNPWIVDTAAATVLDTGYVKIKKLRWVGATTAGHTCVVQDKNTKAVWESAAAAANHVDESDFDDGLNVNGIQVPTLASGKLYVYF